jgi:predicted acyltransferase (DUF342 family)
MVASAETVDGPYVVLARGVIEGRVRGDVVVPAGTHLDLIGQVTGDLVVARGATVSLHGSVEGTVINYGGLIEMHGHVGVLTDFSESPATDGER